MAHNNLKNKQVKLLVSPRNHKSPIKFPEVFSLDGQLVIEERSIQVAFPVPGKNRKIELSIPYEHPPDNKDILIHEDHLEQDYFIYIAEYIVEFQGQIITQASILYADAFTTDYPKGFSIIFCRESGESYRLPEGRNIFCNLSSNTEHLLCRYHFSSKISYGVECELGELSEEIDQSKYNYGLFPLPVQLQNESEDLQATLDFDIPQYPNREKLNLKIKAGYDTYEFPDDDLENEGEWLPREHMLINADHPILFSVNGNTFIVGEIVYEKDIDNWNGYKDSFDFCLFITKEDAKNLPLVEYYQNS